MIDDNSIWRFDLESRKFKDRKEIYPQSLSSDLREEINELLFFHRAIQSDGLLNFHFNGRRFLMSLRPGVPNLFFLNNALYIISQEEIKKVTFPEGPEFFSEKEPLEVVELQNGFALSFPGEVSNLCIFTEGLSVKTLKTKRSVLSAYAEMKKHRRRLK